MQCRFCFTAFFFKLQATEVAMTDFVLNKGPLSVCFNANDFQSYVGGIMTACRCAPIRAPVLQYVYL